MTRGSRRGWPPHRTKVAYPAIARGPKIEAMGLSSRQRESVTGLAFVLVWCTGYIAGKEAVAHAGAFGVLVWRFGLSAAIFAGLAALAGVRRATWREALHSAVSGVLMLAMQFGGVYWAFVHGAGAGISALAIGCMPLLVAVVSMATGAERLSRRGWLGMALGVAGVALVVADRLQPLDSAAAWAGLAIGLAGIGFGTVYQKRHASHLDPRMGLAIQNAAATLALLPLALHEGSLMQAVSPASAGPLAWLVLVNSVGGFTLLFVLIRHGAASAVASLFFLMPPVTAIFGLAWFGESLTPAKVAGFALSAFGVWLATRAASAMPARR